MGIPTRLKWRYRGDGLSVAQSTMLFLAVGCLTIFVNPGFLYGRVAFLRNRDVVSQYKTIRVICGALFVLFSIVWLAIYYGA